MDEEEKIIEKTSQKYTYLFAFLLGMFLMLVVYILFESVNQSQNRIGSQTAKDNADTLTIQDSSLDIVKTSKNPDAVQVSKEVAPSVYLGIEIRDVDSVIAEQLGLPSKIGVLINSVVPSSPAEAEGLKRGDVIIAFNNRTVKDSDRFKDLLSDSEPGDNIKVVILRDGSKQSLYVELVESGALKKTASADVDESTDSSGWGMVLGPVTDNIRNAYNIPDDITGVAVLSVVPGSEADSVGIMPGNVIMGIDKTEVDDMDSFFTAIAADEDTICLLDLYSDGDSRYVSITSLQLKDKDKDKDKLTLRDRLMSLFDGKTQVAGDDEENGNSVILIEHTDDDDEKHNPDEDLGYEKPVCKRLDESGDRYEESDK